MMTVRDVAGCLEAQVLCCEDKLDKQVYHACGSDLMSDVLAFVKDHTVMLTGLVNVQAVRTAEMLDVACIVFVRGKKPTPDILEMAIERDIPLLTTKHTMYESCGLLYVKGLPAVPKGK